MVSSAEISLTAVCEFGCGDKSFVCPRQKVGLGDLELADVGEPGLEYDHQHRVDVIETIEHLGGSQGVAHHLRIALGGYLDALAILEIADTDCLAGDDECVRCAETIRHI